jgi:integrating conjugative element membrane protein (TIGR03747 family)
MSQQGGTPRPRPHRGPISLLLTAVWAFALSAVLACMLGWAIEMVGIYLLWPQQGVNHVRGIVQEDLRYIAAAPRSLLIDDTVGFANGLVSAIERPFRASGLLGYYESFSEGAAASEAPPAAAGPRGGLARFKRSIEPLKREATRWVILAMYVAQDTMLRMATAAFALPAFVLACLLGAIDGMVRRDLRRWQGRRESSWFYHRAKRMFFWSLTGGFTFYLTWPFGGFNPAYMVLVFTALAAMSLSSTVASFKKYV